MDGEVSYRVTAFDDVGKGSLTHRTVKEFGEGFAEPLEAGRNRAPGAPENTGESHDRFGNKVTMSGADNGLNGYGIISSKEDRPVGKDHPFLGLPLMPSEDRDGP